ncbi:MAG TPA: CYTH domain-containing protein, partial [Acidimicrobiales bacterium]
EIERKFRVTRMPPGLGNGTPLRQAYVAVEGDVEVRVRSDGKRHVLTVKGGGGLERDEVELAIDAAAFGQLWALAGDRHLEKTRHRVDLDGLTAELDLYAGALAGLAVVEVEFASRREAEAFHPPDWFGAELTGEPGWSNAALARHGAPPDA